MATTGTTTFELPGFQGELFSPGDAGYDEARAVFNGMIDRRPVLIARCSSADDVVAVVNLARTEGITLSVYGGGHGVTGAAVVDGGICVDLRGMKGIEVDAEARTVRAEGGVTWGEFDAATQAHGLAVTGGSMPTTGIAGLSLGSGSGWLERKFGFACDNLIEAEVVTADGRTVIASDAENPELFWGLRGGSGNFGIVTAFHFRLHELGPVMLAGMLLWPRAVANDLLWFYRDFMLTAPDEVGGGFAFITAPPEPFVPEEVQGHPIVGIIVTYAGPVEDAERVLAPLRAWGPPAVDLVEPMPYTAAWNIHYLSLWFDPDDAQNIEYTRTINGAMKRWATGGVYLNFIGDEGQARVEAGFGKEKYARLQALKKHWDPDNLFCHNQNIRPA